MSRHRNRLDISVGIEIDLISVMGSKLTSFFCGVSKLTLFWGRGIEMTCLWGRSKLILLLCAGRLSFGFHVWIEMNLVSVYGPKLTYFSVLID